MMMLATTAPPEDAYTFADLEAIFERRRFPRELSSHPPEIGLDRLVIAYR